MTEPPEKLILIAGREDYPLLLARAARARGVKKIITLAFKGETSRKIIPLSDEVIWIRTGKLGDLLTAAERLAPAAVIAVGQLAPRNLFMMRPDRQLSALFKGLPVKNAHTIFGALLNAVEKTGLTFLPASSFMQDYIAPAGILTVRAPDERELNDIALGLRTVKDTSHLDIGQTVIVKNGMILAVEAFEGTDCAIRRGGKLGGAGAVAVKVPKRGHDMRFDIPVIGDRTLKTLKRAGISCLALEDSGTIILNRSDIAAKADALGIAITVLEKQAGS
ncbi:MAG: UDP-2,3-diacylglucosamine diphosphatase LpxI [Kiritimatiellales bacterium]